jgi:hypothetical protein
MARPSVQVCMHLSSEQAHEFFQRLANERDSLVEDQQRLRDLLDEFEISILPDYPDTPIELPPAEVLRDFLARWPWPWPFPPWYGPGGYGIFAAALAPPTEAPGKQS